ncbi:MAG: phosphate/phosphite/phosphonate ABC transporter substrate-binding protein [Gammaproteobacteria bacterium]|nr:phosphate/phosphite/phosphonate ABC transporter substrate-binding protein [Gammaproteobacteria bacterium]
MPQFEQRRLFRIWRPILDELEKQTGLNFEFIGTAKIAAFEQSFMAGKFDFVYMNPLHIIKAKDDQGYIPLVRDGSRQLKGVMVVHRGSPIRSIEELRGVQVDFPAPNALGASILNRADFSKRKISIIPRYVQTHSSVYLHVAKGISTAGGGVASTLQAQKKSVRDQLRVIHTTRGIAPHPFSVHPRVPADHRRSVELALRKMASTPQGQHLLDAVPMKKLVRAKLSDYRAIKDWKLESYYIKQ